MREVEIQPGGDVADGQPIVISIVGRVLLSIRALRGSAVLVLRRGVPVLSVAGSAGTDVAEDAVGVIAAIGADKALLTGLL
jgi:hypothetical protein